MKLFQLCRNFDSENISLNQILFSPEFRLNSGIYIETECSEKTEFNSVWCFRNLKLCITESVLW